MATLIGILLLLFWSFAMLAAFASGNAGGLIALPFIILCLYLIKQSIADAAERRRIERAAEESRRVSERKVIVRREWEKTPEGQAHVEAQRRAAAEEERRKVFEIEERWAQHDREQKRAEEEAAVRAWNAFFESKSMQQIAAMSGVEFELFLARLLPLLGFLDIELTAVNDQGGDIVCTSQEGDRVVIQAKRWKKPLGNSVVQEVLGAMLHYGCNRSMIITNSTFTAAAKSLAAKDCRISLCDGHWLRLHIMKYLPPEIPAFDLDRYHKEVRPVTNRISAAEANRTPQQQTVCVERKAEVLAQVSAGTISVEDAARMLAGL